MFIAFFTHPKFLDSQSMPRFASMLSEGMRDKGHTVEIFTAKPYFFKLPVPRPLKKWMGYIDQYILFPISVKRKIKRLPADSLFIFTDHALGPWVPMVADRPHVIHCHDFLAQRSALNQIPQNRTGFTGRQYQAFIRRGYSKGQNFISVSKKTQSDLNQFLQRIPSLSEVVYNGLSQPFKVMNTVECRRILSNKTGIDLSEGYILHVGGNQWYKNRVGVIKIYDAWRKRYKINLPLLMIGQQPSEAIVKERDLAQHRQDIYLLTHIADSLINISYSGASAFLFPSIAEGFGWPIVEAMASGCPVITSNDAPMTEVAGDAASLIPVMPFAVNEQDKWATTAADVLNVVVAMDAGQRNKSIAKGVLNAARFDKIATLDNIEAIYFKVIEKFKVKNKIL